MNFSGTDSHVFFYIFFSVFCVRLVFEFVFRFLHFSKYFSISWFSPQKIYLMSWKLYIDWQKCNTSILRRDNWEVSSAQHRKYISVLTYSPFVLFQCWNIPEKKLSILSCAQMTAAILWTVFLICNASQHLNPTDVSNPYNKY